MSETQGFNPNKSKTRDLYIVLLIILLMFLSLDYSIFHWLPVGITGARNLLISIMIFSTSLRGYKISKIPEFMIPLISTLLAFIYLISEYIAKDILHIPSETLKGTIYEIITNNG